MCDLGLRQWLVSKNTIFCKCTVNPPTPAARFCNSGSVDCVKVLHSTCGTVHDLLEERLHCWTRVSNKLFKPTEPRSESQIRDLIFTQKSYDLTRICIWRISKNQTIKRRKTLFSPCILRSSTAHIEVMFERRGLTARGQHVP